ncbi:host attachment protein [Variovorax sp. YR216]|uniref:host attachment protein n=1 Tax=Variovorax sp. YR216 TaxID=1882828 RepID=UPI00089D7FC0|nr:host attachment protein [Variovorax sp. YR216]SEA54950.1 Protein required for attachment to host cells [Variovorax sp. YR216]
MKSQWIVVANASLARIFRQARHGGLEPVEALTHAQSRMHPSELAENDQGGGERDHHDDRFEARNDIRRKEHVRFARALADRLDKGLAAHEFDSLTILAAKPFLGELRQQLSEAVSARIGVALNNDFTALTAADLAQRLQALHATGGVEMHGAS